MLAEISLGRPERAARVLTRHAAILSADVEAELRGTLAGAEGRWAEAAAAFVSAATAGDTRTRAIRTARAAAAFERAGQPDAALLRYGEARAGLPEIDGWLALRAAAVSRDATTMDTLLTHAPPAARSMVLVVRARARLLLGDVVAAESLLVLGGRPGQAAESAFARGDTTAAGTYAVRALSAVDTAEARRGLVLLTGPVVPRAASDAMAAGRGAARLRDWGSAARFAAHAVALGDSSPTAFLTWGEWLEQAGHRPEALTVYRQAGAAASFHAARATLRLGDRTAGVHALVAFAAQQSEDRNAPAALVLAAEALASDSLLREVTRRWPHTPQASTVRLRLALTRLDAGDVRAATVLLEEEATLRGVQARRAAFLLGRTYLTSGRDSMGRALLEPIATKDSLGYYGLRARALLGLPAPVLCPPPISPGAVSASATVRELAALGEVGFADEVRAVLTYLAERAWDDPAELMEIAMGIAQIGHAPDAIRLGLTAARQWSLDDARVLRAVFPWPDRGLVEAEARAMGLDPYLLAAMIRQESWFSPTARSRAGAVGYMQIMPVTAREVARRLGMPWTDAMLTVVDANLHVGTAHIAGLLARYPGNLAAAVAAYNAGRRPVDRWRRRSGDDPDDLVERIGYPETQDYVRAVLRYRALYRLLYPPGPG